MSGFENTAGASTAGLGSIGVKMYNYSKFPYKRQFKSGNKPSKSERMF